MDHAARSDAPDAEAFMTLVEVFDIARRKRFLVVSTVGESGAPEAALMGFAVTPTNEIVFDTMSTSRKAVNLARNSKAALVIGWDDNVSLQIEGPPRRPAGDGRTAAPASPGLTSPMSSSSRNGSEIPTTPPVPRWSRSSGSRRIVGDARLI